MMVKVSGLRDGILDFSPSHSLQRGCDARRKMEGVAALLQLLLDKAQNKEVNKRTKKQQNKTPKNKNGQWVIAYVTRNALLKDEGKDSKDSKIADSPFHSRLPSLHRRVTVRSCGLHDLKGRTVQTWITSLNYPLLTVRS